MFRNTNLFLPNHPFKLLNIFSEVKKQNKNRGFWNQCLAAGDDTPLGQI